MHVETSPVPRPSQYPVFEHLATVHTQNNFYILYAIKELNIGNAENSFPNVLTLMFQTSKQV